MRTGFLTLVYGLMLSFSVHAAPFDNNNTHTTAVPEQSFQLAATWFLPDWQASSSSRSETAPSGSGDIPLGCENYSPTCTAPKVLGGDKVRAAADLFCYVKCVCPSAYKYTSSNCSGDYILGSETCDGKANSCTARPCSAGGYEDNPKSGWNCTAITYGGRSCYRCSAPCTGLTDKAPCTYGCQFKYTACSVKCQSCYPDNCHNRNAVATPYGCQTYFADCSSKCQTAYPDNCRNYSSRPLKSGCANGCAQGKTYSDCSSRCSVGCKAKCETGYKLSSDELSCTENGCSSGYEAGKTCGAGYELVKSGQSGTQYCGKCVVKACAAGSTSCSGATVAKENGYYSGESKCYTCQTCEQAGKKTCNGSCIASSECCGGCGTGQECQNGSCVTVNTCRSAVESKGGKLISKEEDLIDLGATGGNLYVSGTPRIIDDITLKNVTINDAAQISPLCDSGTLNLRNVIADGKIVLNIPLKARKISTLGSTIEGFQLETSSNLTIEEIFLNSGSKNSLNLSRAASVTIEQIATETYSNSSALNLDIRGGNSRLIPYIGTILINGRSYLNLFSYLNICSINLSNSYGLANGPTVYFQGGSYVTGKCTRSTYEPFVSMSRCGTVNQKCLVFFGPSNSGVNSCFVDFNNRSLSVGNAVAVAYVVGTVQNVASWGVTSASDTSYVTQFRTNVSGRLQFSDNSSVAGGSMCEFTLKYDRYGTYYSVSNSSQIDSIKSGYCSISSR